MKYISLLLALFGSHSAKPRVPLGQLIVIKAGDYFFQAPATAKAGLTTIRITSVLGNHLFQLYRLEGSHTAAELVAALATSKSPAWAKNLGGSGADYANDASESIFMLEPGRYAIVCPVRAPDHKRHYTKGMYSELRVEPQRFAGALPKPDVEITASEYIWRFSAPLRADRRQIIRFTNAGTVPHHVKFINLYSSVTEGRARRWRSGDPPVPGTVETVSPLDPGGSVLVAVNLPPGNYLLQCVPQMAHGMMQRITVR